LEAVKKVEKLALLIMSEDKSNKQKTSYSFSFIDNQTKTFHRCGLSQSTDLRW